MFARILFCIETLSFQCSFNPGMFTRSGRNIPILLESYQNAQRFRAGQNLKHLHCARESIKGKVYAGVLGVDRATTALVSKAEVVDEILD